VIISKDIIKSYKKTRTTANSSIICHAPFQSINFAQGGIATACCYNREHVLGTYPENTIDEIWFGTKAEELREYIKLNNLGHGCKICAMQLQSENFAAVHARHYDFQSDHPIKSIFKKSINYIKNKRYAKYPRVIEFELSNTCNLECVMCNGYFSSSIRKNVEKLPPMKMAYDDSFVEQLADYIPHLTDAKFLGGEPFLIPIYYKIWNDIILLNPKCKVHITTNATILNDKAWNILNKLPANIIISVDSINEETFNNIRKGANWTDVNNNIKLLHSYTKKKGTDLNFSVCPMILNWEEMPEIIQHGINNNIYIYLNTVINPENLSLKYLEKFDAEKIIKFYSEYNFTGSGFYYDYNLKQFLGLINMINYWHSLTY
jgi:MoaA/NifB/PqqE/SkfB family radical SAM enzyme